MRRDSLAVPGKTFGHLFLCVCFSKELKNVSNLLDIHWTVEVHKNEQKEKCPFAAQQIIYFIYDYSCAADTEPYLHSRRCTWTWLNAFFSLLTE